MPELPSIETEPALTPLAKSEVAARETRRFLKFLVVGGFGFLVDTGTLSACVFVFSMNRVLAKGVAFSLAVISNFIWNRLWTYPESRSKHVVTQIVQFFVVSGVGLGINLVVFHLADKFATAHQWGSTYALYFAQCAAVGVALFWNYAANRLITYNDISLGG